MNMKKRTFMCFPDFKEKAGIDYAASRGEYLNGLIMANYLGFEFEEIFNYIIENKMSYHLFDVVVLSLKKVVYLTTLYISYCLLFQVR